ncbi:MAG: AraC family transcriptional regulator [Treponema sp.]|jgi:AraC-like DNA-binding protein/ligand-binding sensor protein|nr:AraC family transcriptional regulator [Treponema sp.]
MSKLSIIQQRELEPMMLKAGRIAKHYEKASNCTALVMGHDLNSENVFDSICGKCNKNLPDNPQKKCGHIHMEAVNKARQLGGSYIYLCNKGNVFWTSPFYSGERFAGALMSGGVPGTEKNSDRVKALAQIMLLCANQISGMSFVQKNVVYLPLNGKRRELEYSGCDNDEYDLAAENLKTKHVTQNNDDSDNDEGDGYLCLLDMERMLLASHRRGDKEEGQKILLKLLKFQYREVKNNFPAFRLKALELAVLLSRAAANPKDIKDNTSLETTNRLFKKIEECTNFGEISEILKTTAERMSRMIFSFHGVRHFSALRKAERFIWDNYTRKLSLKEIADASGLSAPYFSTVFKDEMGENLSNYLNRLRVEKAAAMLITTDLSINEIAVACGFEDQSWFSKIFRNNTGFTPGKYRERGMSAGGMYSDNNILG